MTQPGLLTRQYNPEVFTVGLPKRSGDSKTTKFCLGQIIIHLKRTFPRSLFKAVFLLRAYRCIVMDELKLKNKGNEMAAT